MVYKMIFAWNNQYFLNIFFFGDKSGIRTHEFQLNCVKDNSIASKSNCFVKFEGPFNNIFDMVYKIIFP